MCLRLVQTVFLSGACGIKGGCATCPSFQILDSTATRKNGVHSSSSRKKTKGEWKEEQLRLLGSCQLAVPTCRPVHRLVPKALFHLLFWAGLDHRSLKLTFPDFSLSKIRNPPHPNPNPHSPDQPYTNQPTQPNPL